VYQAVPGSRGLDLLEDDNRTDYDIYKATTHAVQFVSGLCNQLSPEFFNHLQITSHLVDDASRPGYYRICFDYCVDGVSVLKKTEAGFESAIVVEIENGYLQSYRQYMDAYEELVETQQLSPMLSAADSLVDSMYEEGSPLFIQAMTPIYIEEADGRIPLAWKASVNGIEAIVE